jgi:hypothetical protein
MLLARSTDWIFLINMPIKKYCRRIAPKSIEVVVLYMASRGCKPIPPWKPRHKARDKAVGGGRQSENQRRINETKLFIY